MVIVMIIFVAVILAIRLIMNITVNRVQFVLHTLEVTGSFLGPVTFSVALLIPPRHM